MPQEQLNHRKISGVLYYNEVDSAKDIFNALKNKKLLNIMLASKDEKFELELFRQINEVREQEGFLDMTVRNSNKLSTRLKHTLNNFIATFLKVGN